MNIEEQSSLLLFLQPKGKDAAAGLRLDLERNFLFVLPGMDPGLLSGKGEKQNAVGHEENL